MNQNNRFNMIPNNNRNFNQQHHRPQQYLNHQRNLNPNAQQFQPQQPPYRFTNQNQQNNQNWNARGHQGPPMNFQRHPPQQQLGSFLPPQQPGGFLPPQQPSGFLPPQQPGGFLPPQQPGGFLPPPPPQGFQPNQNHQRPPLNFLQSFPPPPDHHSQTNITPPFANQPLPSPSFSNIPPPSISDPNFRFPPPFVNASSVQDATTTEVDPKQMYKEAMVDVVGKWKKTRSLENEDTNEGSKFLNIHSYKSSLKELFSKIEKLRSMNDQLADNMESDVENWTKLIQGVNSLKDEVLSLQNKVLHVDQVGHVEALLEKRRKKRLRLRKKKQEEADETIKSLSKRIKLHQKIDEWQHHEVATLHRRKMLESLKNEAGESLMEVKRKQNEAQELIQVLKSLKDLREIRKSTAIYKGIFVTEQDDLNFEKKIKDATDLLQEQNQIYEDEERALRVLREEEAEDFERIQVEKRKKRKQKHQKALHSVDPMAMFRSYWLQAEESIPSLIHIRSLWDSYICAPLTPGCSRLPDDYPEPSVNNSDAWQKYLINTAKSPKKSLVAAR